MKALVQVVISGVTLGAIYALMSMGLSLVWGGLRVLNLTQGALFMLGAYASIVAAKTLGLPAWLSLVAAFFSVGAIGVVLYFGPIRMLLGRQDRDNAILLVTIGIAIIFENLALFAFGPRNKAVPTLVSGNIRIADVAVTWNAIVMTAASIALLALLGGLLKWTRAGLAIRALAQNRDGAQLNGISMDATFAFVMFLSSGLAGIGGVLLSSYYFVNPYVGQTYLLTALVVTILGGLGSLSGTLYAAFIIGMVQSGVSYYLGVRWSLPVFFGLIIVMLIVRPAELPAGYQRNGCKRVVDERTSAGLASMRLKGFVRVKRDLLPFLLLVALFIALPFAVPDPALLGILTVMFVWLGMNMSWNLVLGYAGMLSFGQVAFFAVGAYAAAILNVHLGWPGWLDTVAGGLAGGVAALLIGIAAIRLRGVYVALVTLAFHEFLRSLVSTDYSGLTGGPNGLAVARYVDIPDLATQSFIGYGIGLVLFLTVGVCVFLVLRSPIALALVSVRDAEHVASARGVRRTRYQVAVFVLSGALGGVLGGFYAHYVGVVSPTLFSFSLVITLLSMIIVGGWGTFWGPIVGTIVITLVSNYVQGELPRYQSIIIAGILVFMVLAFRHGLVGIFEAGLRFGSLRKSGSK